MGCAGVVKQLSVKSFDYGQAIGYREGTYCGANFIGKNVVVGCHGRGGLMYVMFTDAK